MGDDVGTRASHRMAAVELMQRSTVAMNSGYPDHEQVRHLDTRALTHALLALSAPVEESTAPVSSDTGEGHGTVMHDGLIGTYMYATGSRCELCDDIPDDNDNESEKA